MFDNNVFENFILKKDVEGLESYLKEMVSSDKSEDIFSSAKAVYFCILKTGLSIDFIKGIKEERFVEMLRRMLFCYIRNNPPSDIRQKARKVLISMGFLAAEASEALYSPLVWNFYEVFYRYELTNRPKIFSKLVKLLAKTRDSYTRDSAIKFVKEYKDKNSKVVEALIEYCKVKENSSIKEVYEFLDKLGVTPIVEPTTEVVEPVTETVEPVTEKVEPATEKVEPTIEKVEPATEKVEPTIEKVEPTTEAVEPTTEAVEPVTEKVDPATEKVEPTTEKVEPTTEKVEPTTEKVEPTTETVEPTTETVELSTEKVEPVTEKVDIATEKVEPATEKVEIATEKVEPTTETVEPATEKVEPVTEKVEPVTEKVEPTTEKVESTTGTVESATEKVKSATEKVKSLAEAVKSAREAVKSVTEAVKSAAEAVGSVTLTQQSSENSRILKSSFVSSKSVLIPPPKVEEFEAVEKPNVESELQAENNSVAENLSKSKLSARELRDALKLNFVNIKAAGADISPTLLSKTIEMLLELIKIGSDHDMRFVESSINSYFVSNSFMQDALRRELKSFMSDSELPEFVSKRAMEFLPLLGKTKQKQSLSSILMTYSEMSDDEVAVESTSNTLQISFVDDLSRSVSERILKYLKSSSSSSYDARLEMCKQMIEDGISFDEYKDLIDFDLPKSGKRYFDIIVPAAKAILFSNKFEFQDKAEEARQVLFVSLFYSSCPDILKMECFETLKRSGYLDIVAARNVYKQYAIVFVKNALLNKSTGAACRALSDMISISIPGAIGRENFEGKNIEYLLDAFISLLMKEKDEKLFNYAIDILNHLSFEEHSALLPVSVRIQPVNYEKAIDITELLVMKRNIWASSILIDAVGENYMDIRNKAVDSLSRCGANMPVDYRRRAVNLIFEKLDVAYDEEKQAQYIEAARNIDPVITAEVLILLFANSGLTDRKEIGNRLMGTLTIMSSNEFLELFKGMDNLRILYNYLTTSHRDKFTVDFARQFIDLYRVHFSNVNGEETWVNILSDTSSEFVNMINELWNLQF